jgi:3-oxoadipate enol-lactonase
VTGAAGETGAAGAHRIKVTASAQAAGGTVGVRFDVDVPDGRLVGEEAGAGPAVVLIHGFSFDQSMWDPQFSVLARHYRVIRYDLRGFGQSGPPAAGRGHVEDLLCLLDALDIGQAHLVGLSLGANIALATASLHPGRVRSIVLASPGLPGHVWTRPRPPDEAASVARRDGIEAAKRWWLAHEIFRSADAYPEARRCIAEMVGRFPAHQWGDGPAATPLPSLTGYLRGLRLPTLILNGALDDPGYREIATALLREIPDARRCEFPDAGHLLNLEAPDTFNARLLSFLSARRADDIFDATSS